MDDSDWLSGDSGDENSEIGDNFTFMVLDLPEIQRQMFGTVQEIQSMLDISVPIARLLLNHYKWKKEVLLNAFLEVSSIDELLAEAKIPVRSDRKVDRSAETSLECVICLTTYTKDDHELVGLEECGHKFCKYCWESYLNSKILDSPKAAITCAAHKCVALMDDEMILGLLTKNHIKEKFHMLIRNSFVQHNPLLRWCPATNCCFAIKVARVEPKGCLCRCGYEFCFGCTEFWHAPIDCQLLDKWKKTLRGDLSTNRWLLLNTNKCPQCRVDIQKNGGCNHMTCKSCQKQFCWVCLGNWTGSHTCNQFDDTSSTATGCVQAAKRHLHFETRYVNHLLALKLQIKMYDTVDGLTDRLSTMQGWTQQDIVFCRRGFDILNKSRLILSATYVFAFSTAICNQLTIFQDNQRDLEIATETLCEHLEREVKDNYDNAPDLGVAIKDKYAYCERRQKVLLDHVYEGYRNGWWEENTSS